MEERRKEGREGRKGGKKEAREGDGVEEERRMHRGICTPKSESPPSV